MKRLTTALVLLTLSGIALAQGTSGEFREGVHYNKIDPPLKGRPVDGVQVTEVFSYLCNHCATFEPYMQSWQQRMPEGVQFSRIPVEFGRAIWSLYARAYVTAAVLGIADEAHVDLMDTLWKEQRQMRSMEELAEFYSAYGVEEDNFVSTSKSFAVDMRMKNEQRMVREAGVSGTPSMLVNGKYRVSAGGAVNSFDTMLEIVDHLVDMESAETVAQEVPGAATPEPADS